jgi:serine/threonine protein phosphatase 1
MAVVRRRCYIQPMLTRLFGKSRRENLVVPRVDASTRVYAIGDVHGRDDLLAEMHSIVHHDAYAHQAPRNVVIYLGDLIDRGPESRAVIDRLLDDPIPGLEPIFLMGNHEETLLEFLDDTRVVLPWLAYGGEATLASYGIHRPESLETEELLRLQDELRAALPARHLEFLRGLRLMHVEGDYLFVHAGIRPSVPLAGQTAQDVLWIRDDFLRSERDFGKIIVHGHSITERPDVRRNRIGIDTGAFASGRLTCLVLSGTEWYFLQTGSPDPES